MARKGWNLLSDDYRYRLESKGITKKGYESGASIKGARGHANTPEHPLKASLLDEINLRKQELFGSQPRWDTIRAEYNTADAASKVSISRIKDLLDMDIEDWYEEMIHDQDIAELLGYH